MSFHFRHLATSAPLQKVRDFLSQRGVTGATGWEIQEVCNVLNPSGAVSELRHNGLRILTERERTSANGRRVFRYTLLVF